MGKGDKRTRRGKLFRGTYGKSRPSKRPAKAGTSPAQGTPGPTKASNVS